MLVIFLIILCWIYNLLDDDDRESLRRLGEFLLLSFAQIVERLLRFSVNFCLLILCFQYWSPYFNFPVKPDYLQLLIAFTSTNLFTVDPNFEFHFAGFLPSTTPFQVAVAHSNDAEFLEYLRDYLGASLQTLSDRGENLLHLAATSGCLTGLRFALNNGVDVDAADARGFTPMMSAVAEAPLPCLTIILRLLKERGAAVEKSTPQDETILHLAVGLLKPTIQSLDRVKEVVEFGIENGVKAKRKNAEGKTAVELALAMRDELVQSVRRTVETDSRYGIDSRPFLKRYQAKYDLVAKLLEGANGSGARGGGGGGSGAPAGSLSSALKFIAKGFNADTSTSTASSASEEEEPMDLSPGAQMECSICLENQPDTALDPCGHTICQSCSNELSVCPYCRTLVKKTLRIYR